MPKVRKLVGNYEVMAGKMLKLSYFHPLMQKQLRDDVLQQLTYVNDSHQILIDLNRNRFLPTNNKTVDDFITTWANPADHSYFQGNMSGANFTTLIMNAFIQQSPKFLNEKRGRTEENRLEEYFLKRGHVFFGYYDDQGVPCGVSINYSQLDPSLWTASIIRNTTGKAEDREVLILTPDELHEIADGFTTGAATSATFFSFLRSAEAQEFLQGTLLNNGEVNIERLNELRQSLDAQYTISTQNGTYVARKEEIDAFVQKQETAIKELEEQFEIDKISIEEEPHPDNEEKIQELRKRLEFRTKLIKTTANEEEIAAAKIALPPRSGLELLEDTLRSDTENTKALGRVLLAIKSGTLTVNGQAPDEAYPIGEYLTHGGRINFDVSALSAEEQQQFYNFITNNQAKPRAFATHRAGGTDANGSPAEAKSGLLGAISDAFRALFGASKHAGINLAIGGNHIASREGAPGGLGKNPDESGEWGHMYLHQDSNIVMVGVEASAPGKHNLRTGEAHSKTGAAGELSPFLQKKIDSKALREEQIEAGKTPLSTKEKYNWATVKISSDQLRQMMIADQGADYVALVKAKPDNAQPAEQNRQEKMEAWAKATKEGNKTSMAAKVLGFLLFAAGIVLAFTPIPGVSQAVGTWLAGMGIGVATGTVTLGAGLTAATVGLGVFALGTRQDPEKPHTLYEKNLSKLPPVEVVEKPVVVQEHVVHDVVQEHVVRDVVQEHVVVEPLLRDSGSDHDLRGFEEVDAELRQVVKPGDEVMEAEKIVGGINEPKTVHSPVVVDNPSTKKEVVDPRNTDQTTFTL